MADEAQLAAAHRSVEQMRELISATSSPLPLAGRDAGGDEAAGAVGLPRLLHRDYPTRVPEGRNLAKLRFEPAHR